MNSTERTRLDSPNYTDVITYERKVEHRLVSTQNSLMDNRQAQGTRIQGPTFRAHGPFLGFLAPATYRSIIISHGIAS